MQKYKVIEIMKNIGKISEKINVKSYAVGGLVRDFILEKDCDDLDITSDGIDKLAAAMIERGGKIVEKNSERFMGKIIYYKGLKIDLVAPRKESYHPSSIKPLVKVGTFEDDVFRRDFTINALYYDLSPTNFMRFVDLTGKGLKDLRLNLLDTPLEPEQTFFDDPSRMLRAVRFAATRGFDIAERVVIAIQKMAHEIHRVPYEIIHKEIMKGAGSPSFFRILDRVGLADTLFPEVTVNRGVYQHPQYHTEDAYEHILRVTELINTDKPLLRIAGFFHDIAKASCEDAEGHAYGHIQKGLKMVKPILRKYKFANKEVDYIYQIIRYHHNFHNYVKESQQGKNITISLRRFISKHPISFIMDLYQHALADTTSDHPNSKPYIKSINNIIDEIHDLHTFMIFDGSKQKLKISGHDIMRYGFKGKSIGEIKSLLQRKVFDGELPNKRDALLDALEEIHQDFKKAAELLGYK